MFLHFPHLHPDLLPQAQREALPAGVFFLDPGLAKPGAPQYWLPESAPFDRRTAKALLADTLRYGETMANPRDIATQGLVEQAATFAPESSRAVQAAVERSMLGEAAPETEFDPLDTARRQAQMLLLLAWSLEERLLELHGTEERLRAAWGRLDESVARGEGVGADEDAEVDDESLAIGRELSGLTMPDTAAFAVPWRRLFECFAVLAPDSVLCTLDAEIAAVLAEAGAPEGPLDAVPGALRVFQAPAWMLMGLDRQPAAKPWLGLTMTLGVCAPAAKA